MKMGLKKFASLAVVCAFVLLGTVSGAWAAARPIQLDDMALGGIYPGATESHVRDVYGEPDREDELQGNTWGDTKKVYYGTGYSMLYFGRKFDADNTYVMSISTTNPAISMPSGIHVGMHIGEALAIFSDLKKIGPSHYGAPHLWGTSGIKGQPFQRLLVIEIDQNRVIKQIRIQDVYDPDTNLNAL